MSFHLNRKQFLTSLCGAAGTLLLDQCSNPQAPATTGGSLPSNTVFKGENKFNQLCQQARSANWAQLPLSRRTVTVGQSLLGTTYGNYTLEIDDHIEAPSVNFQCLDCWT